MNSLNFLKSNKQNFYYFLYLGLFLFSISILDVAINAFLKINITSFLPGILVSFFP